MTMLRYHTYNFRFQLLLQKIVWACNIAAVCYNSHVPENMLSSNRFTVLQYKEKPYLGFHNLGCHFDTQKRLKKTLQ